MTRAIKINDYDTLSKLMTAQLRPGVTTNMVADKEGCMADIQAGALLAIDFPGGLILLRRREGFQKLNFYLQKGAEPPALEIAMPTVMETAFRARDTALQGSCGLWERLGFRRQFTRQRMVRRPGETVLSSFIQARLAGREDFLKAQAILKENFPPLTGCLPTERELLEGIERRFLFVAEGGVLQAAAASGGTELRHLAVAPSMRRQGVAQALLRAYMAEWGEKPSRVWVRQDNQPALGFYKKNAYICDGWTSIVHIAGKDGYYHD